MEGLIVADAQVGITTRFDFCAATIPTLAGTVEGARAAGLPIVFVVAALRPSGADLSPDNAVMGQFFAMGDAFHEGSTGTAVDPRLGVLPTDTVVRKRRAGAFHGSDLDLVLRSQGIDHLVLAGFATSAVVLATALDAVDRDYRVTVLRDCCADPEPDVHDFVVDRLLPNRGVDVRDSGSWSIVQRGPRT